MEFLNKVMLSLIVSVSMLTYLHASQEAKNFRYQISQRFDQKCRASFNTSLTGRELMAVNRCLTPLDPLIDLKFIDSLLKRNVFEKEGSAAFTKKCQIYMQHKALPRSARLPKDDAQLYCEIAYVDFVQAYSDHKTSTTWVYAD